MSILETIYYTGLETPMGTMWAARSDYGLVQFHIAGGKDQFLLELKHRIKANFKENPGNFQDLRSELKRYFNKEPLIFNGPFDLRGTPFQVKVWKAIHDIPYGKLTSYGNIAKEIGHPKAVRAVGNAVGDNPMGLIIPCHRVVASKGLGGFGGGLELKRKLLTCEGVFKDYKGTPEKEVDLQQFFK